MVGFSQKQHRRDLKDIRGSVPPVGIDSGGTVHAIKVDDQGRILGNIISGEVVATLGTLSVMKSGTIDVAKTVQSINELKSGTVTQVVTPRSASFGTIASGFPVDGASQVPGTADVRTLDGFSLGMDADGTVEVSHQIQMSPGGSWREDGLGTLVTNEERISTINHKGLKYRPSLTNKDASSTVEVNVDYLGN